MWQKRFTILLQAGNLRFPAMTRGASRLLNHEGAKSFERASLSRDDETAPPSRTTRSEPLEPSVPGASKTVSTALSRKIAESNTLLSPEEIFMIRVTSEEPRDESPMSEVNVDREDPPAERGTVDDIKLFLVDNFIWVLLIGSTLVFGAINGSAFFNVSNLRFVVFSTVTLSFLVVAEGLCLISGNFDLSVGQTAGFTGMLNALLLAELAPWMPWYLGVLTILIVGAVIGAFNGFFVAGLGLNPFLITLGTYLVLQYGTLEVSLDPIRDGIPAPYLAIGGESVAGVPIAIFVLIAGAGLFYVILRRTKFGSNVYSVGGDPDASKRAGISVTNTVFWVFVLSGVLSAVSGLLYTGFLGSATPGMADGSLFLAFAGAVIGGASLSGGRGSILNMIGGALLIGVFDAGLLMTGASGNQVNIFFGFLVIAAVIVNRAREAVSDRLTMSG